MKTISPDTKRRIASLQRGEATEQIIYERLAAATPDGNNKKILERIAADERRHYEFFKELTGRDIGPDRARALFYYLVCRILGVTFGLKLLERDERYAQETYRQLAGVAPGIDRIIADENEHEKRLIGMIDEERLRYVGSMVLGLSDALVEMTGTLAGFTLALSNVRLIAAAGLITGIAAALSMAASEYQSTRSEDEGKNSLKASVYTGIIYLATVLFLVAPFLILPTPIISLALTMTVALGIILFFTYYLSVARDIPFFRRFLEMGAIIFGVASLSFLIGWAIKSFFGINL